MAIDLSKLENCRSKGHRVIARCPACAEIGHDRKGNHLFINEEGRFGCVVYPGLDGHEHRKRIFELVGDKGSIKKTIEVKVASQTSQNWC